MDTEALSRQHRSIIDKASLLGGRCRQIRTREDADEARRLIAEVDLELVAHLSIEDAELFPLLMDARDEGLRLLGSEAFDDVGGLLEIWFRFRDHWTVTAMLADPRRFAMATGGVLGALSVRVEMEEDSLYPAADAAARRGGRLDTAA
ncbi:hemerythrin domain-containing protein [Brevundimonas sp.]|uniref:hemerythrin domain-containing protein n=1 Tax=Brevundimonas sp. TaxID=1871086 RepID=UPI002C725411|nr:hemerythrin domain-containing protein [Brevundimonas sp.]HWQ85321.1 hemerythrin domain-containing protein [Brevundimonas sp.]